MGCLAVHDTSISFPKSCWALAMAAAVHIHNRVTNRGTSGVPYELVIGRRANLSSMRVFGCRVYVHIDKSQRHTLDDRVCGLGPRVSRMAREQSLYLQGGEQPQRGFKRGCNHVHSEDRTRSKLIR
jgi:hypothetical protein